MGRHPLTEHAAWVMAFTQNIQMPWQLIRPLNASCINSTHRLKQQIHTPQNTLPTFSLPSREGDVLIEHFGCLLTLILGVSNQDTWRESERITHRIPAGDGLLFTLQEPQIAFEKARFNCREKNMSPLPQTRAINTFFILYTCSETSVFRWPRSLPVNVFLSSGEHNVVSYATLPEGNRTRTLGSLKTGRLQTWL